MSKHYKATIGNEAFEIELDDAVLRLNGEDVTYSFDAIEACRYALLLNGKSQSVFVEALPDGRVRVSSGDRQVDVRVQDEHDLLLERFGLDATGDPVEREVRAPMPGLVLKVLVEAGQTVREGDGLLVLEAMKMENELRASGDGTISAVHVTSGEAVGKDTVLVEFET